MTRKIEKFYSAIIDLFRTIYRFIFNPFNVIHISTLNRKDYVDRDVVLLHASFQILTDFVEKEMMHMYGINDIQQLKNKILQTKNILIVYIINI